VTLKVLIVEDDPMSAEFLKLFLEDENYTVFAANSASEAERILEGFVPDIVLTDMLLGESNGADIAKLCRDKGVSRIIAVSGLDQARLSQMKIDVSLFDKLLLKPVDFDELLKVIKL